MKFLRRFIYWLRNGFSPAESFRITLAIQKQLGGRY